MRLTSLTATAVNAASSVAMSTRRSGRNSKVSMVRAPSPAARNACDAASPSKRVSGRPLAVRILVAAIALRSATSRSSERYDTRTRSTSTTGRSNPAATSSGARAEASIRGWTWGVAAPDTASAMRIAARSWGNRISARRYAEQQSFMSHGATDELECEWKIIDGVSAFGKARATVSGSPLSPDELRRSTPSGGRATTSRWG